jgi:YRPW motif-containing protein
MGFRECVAEVARYMTNVEGLDMKDPMRIRLLNHLENYLAQRELAINAAVAASSQMGVPKFSPIPTNITLQPTPGPFIPITTTTQRATPDRISPTFPEGIPRIALSTTPVISFASSTATVPVFGAAPMATIPTTIPVTKVEQPSVSPVKKSFNSKQPFRPWADAHIDD